MNRRGWLRKRRDGEGSEPFPPVQFALQERLEQLIEELNSSSASSTWLDPDRDAAGTVEIRNGRVVITDPVGRGPLPCIAPGSGVVVTVNGKVITGATPLKSGFRVEVSAPASDPSCSLSLEVAESRLEARLVVLKTRGRERVIDDAPPSPRLTVSASVVRETEPEPPTGDQVLELLRERGVTYGIDPSAVAAAIAGEGSTVVARGEPPVCGEDARIEYYFSPREFEVRQVGEEESLNPLDRYELVTVEEGAVLARKLPARPGMPGITVTGEILPPPAVRDLELKVGTGVGLFEEGCMAVATRPGRPILKNNVLSVLPVHTVEGDVDVKRGNLTFPGHVVVKGNVAPGIKIRVGGDLLIKGDVEKASIVAGANVKIGGSVIDTVVTAGGLDALGGALALRLEELSSELELLARAVVELKSHPGYQAVARELRTDGPIVRILLDRRFPNVPRLIAALLEPQNCPTQAAYEELQRLAARYTGLGPVDLDSVQEIEDDVAQLKERIAKYREDIGSPATLQVGYALNSSLEASGWVRVLGEGCINSVIQAGQGVRVSGRSGVFRGGSITSGGDVHVKSLGAPGGVATLVRFLAGRTVTAETVFANVTLKTGQQAVKVNADGRLMEAFVDGEGILRVEKLKPDRLKVAEGKPHEGGPSQLGVS